MAVINIYNIINFISIRWISINNKLYIEITNEV